MKAIQRSPLNRNRIFVDLKTTNPKHAHLCAPLNYSRSMGSPEPRAIQGTNWGTITVQRLFRQCHGISNLDYYFPMKTSAGSLNLVLSLLT